MSGVRTVRTIRAYTGQPRFKKMLESVLAKFPNYKPIEDGKSYRDFPQTMSCTKLIIKAYVDCGAGYQPPKIVKRYYKPND